MTDAGALLIPMATVVAVATNVAFLWPQAFRLVRSGTVAGVAPATWAMAAAVHTGWSAYAWRTGYGPLVVANVSCAVAAVSVLVLGVRRGWSPRWPVGVAAAAAAAVVVVLVAPVVVAMVLTATGIALTVPQFRRLWRARNPEEAAGVSAATWLLATVTSVAWLVVSVHRHAWPVAVANVTSVLLSAALLTLVLIRQRGHRPA